jgi:hypothetical protein
VRFATSNCGIDAARGRQYMRAAHARIIWCRLRLQRQSSTWPDDRALLPPRCDLRGRLGRQVAVSIHGDRHTRRERVSRRWLRVQRGRGERRSKFLLRQEARNAARRRCLNRNRRYHPRSRSCARCDVRRRAPLRAYSESWASASARRGREYGASGKNRRLAPTVVLQPVQVFLVNLWSWQGIAQERHPLLLHWRQAPVIEAARSLLLHRALEPHCPIDILSR